jgi:hypothetical protein
VGSTPTRVTAITTIARAASVRQTFVIAHEKASAGHWRATVFFFGGGAVTHPPPGFGGSTPSRRTCFLTTRSSSGSGSWPLKPATRVRLPHGSLNESRAESRESRARKYKSRELFVWLSTLDPGHSSFHGQVVQSEDTRRSARRAPCGLGSSTLPLVIEKSRDEGQEPARRIWCELLGWLSTLDSRLST